MKSRAIKGPRRFVGALRPPGDKSITHRALLLAGIARGTTKIHQPLTAADCRATATAMTQLGATVKRAKDVWTVDGVGTGGLSEPDNVIDVGNSGTAIRLLTGLVASQPFLTVLTGDESVRRRPMKRIVEPLSAMGANIVGRENNTRAPLVVQGSGGKKLQGMRHDLTIASAQVKSALLLAGLHADGDTEVHEPTQSRDHTERMLMHLGAPITFEPGFVRVRPHMLESTGDLFVPGDLSSAAFFLVGAVLTERSDLTLTEVGVNPTRGGILEVLSEMGATIGRGDENDASGEPTASLRAQGGTLTATNVDGARLVRLIDEVPVLAVAAMCANGTTRIEGAGELRVKESDRIAAVEKLVAAFGGTASSEPEALVVEGGGSLTAATVNSGGDHRIAMAAAIAACLATGESVIEDVACVETSYPGFFDDLDAVTEAV